MKKTIPVLLAAVVVISGLLVGCSASNKQKTSTSTANTTGTNAVYIPDVVNVGIDGDPADLDPLSALQFHNGTTNPIFMQTLGYMNSDASFSGVLMKTYKLVGDKKVDITLYDNIMDQAGNHFTAADAAWCVGKDIAAKNSFAAGIVSSEKTGDYTFQVTYDHNLFLNDLTNLFTNLYFCTEAAWEASPDHMKTDPVTTAPYKVIKYVPGSSLTLEKWDGYWKKDASLRTPVERQNVKTIKFSIILEASQMAMGLETGAIDFAQNIELENLKPFQSGGQYADKFKVDTIQEGLNNVLWPNCSAKSPMSNLSVREAVYYAIDGAAIAKKMYGDEAVPSKCVGSAAYPDYISSWATDNYWNYNPEKSKELLKAAGYDKSHPLHLKLIVMNQPTFAGIMKIVLSYLTAVGIDANLVVENGASYFADAGNPAKWDLQEFPAISNGFIASAWSNLNKSSFPWGPINFAQDNKLEQLVTAARSVKTHSKDSVAAAQAYINKGAYAYGVSGNYVNLVYPSSVSKFVLSDHKWLIPNACTYTKKQ